MIEAFRDKTVFEKQIVPLAQRLAEICKDHGIPMHIMLITEQDNGKKMYLHTAGGPAAEEITTLHALVEQWAMGKEPTNATND
jgi:hypothetical protein